MQALASLTIMNAWHRILGPVEGSIFLPFPLPFVSLVKEAIEAKMVNMIEGASNPEYIYLDSRIQLQRGDPASSALRKPLPC